MSITGAQLVPLAEDARSIGGTLTQESVDNVDTTTSIRQDTGTGHTLVCVDLTAIS